MSSILFKEEINHIYETNKCALVDGDLRCIIRAEDEWGPEGACQENTLLQVLLKVQNDLYELYQTAIELLGQDGEEALLCADHLDQVRITNQMVQKATKLTIRPPRQNRKYGFVG